MSDGFDGSGGASRLALTRRSVLGGAAGLAATAVAPGVAWSQAAAQLPPGAINVAIPGSAGGAADLILRIVYEKMRPILDRPFTLDPRPGAGGLVAGQFVQRSKADGMTLLFITGAHTILPGMHRKTTNFDAVDFEFISMISTTPFIFSVGKDHPAKTFQDLIDISKKNPGKESFTTVGDGSTHQMIGALTQQSFGLKWVEVPYRDLQAGLVDVASGRVTIALTPTASANAMISAGQLRPLALSQKPRLDEFPGIPAVSEFPGGVDAGSYYGLAAPKGTPPEIVALLNKAVVASVADPDTQKALKNVSNIPNSSTPQEFRDRIASDVARWTKLIVEMNL